MHAPAPHVKMADPVVGHGMPIPAAVPVAWTQLSTTLIYYVKHTIFYCSPIIVCYMN